MRFGKKLTVKRVKKTKKSVKPSARLLRICKKYHVKTTRKVGGKRVYKNIKFLKKECLKKARALLKRLKKSKIHRGHKSVRRKSSRRRSGFGESAMAYPFEQPGNFGYNQPVKQAQQTLSQSSAVVANEKANDSRPESMKLQSSSVPVNGVYRDFFGQQVPTQPPPEWNYMGQPDGSLYAVGAPFYRYKNPIAAFGKKARDRSSKGSSQCSGLSQRICNGNPKYRGCRRKAGTATKGVVYEGPSLQFGRRRRPKCKRVSKLVCKGKRSYNILGSPCNRLNRRVCNTTPGCKYIKGKKYRGCRRYKSKSMLNKINEPASGYSMSGDDDIGAYAEAAGISFFGRRRRRSRKCYGMGSIRF